MNKTFYSRIVSFKKRYVKARWVPKGFDYAIDGFFNNAHNVFIISLHVTRDFIIRTKDVTRDAVVRSRDLTRDSIIRTKDVTKDSIVHTKDALRDSLIRTKDVTRDSILRTAEHTRDSLIQTKDITKDTLIRTKDVARDSIIHTKDISRDSFIDSIDTAKGSLAETKRRLSRSSYKFPGMTVFGKAVEIGVFIPVFLYGFADTLSTAFKLRKYRITEASDQAAVARIGTIVANSNNVRDRVKKYYGRDAEIVHPPVPYEEFFCKPAENFWLSVNRLTKEKRIDMQISAWNELKHTTLLIVGGYDNVHTDYVHELKQMRKGNIVFMETVSESDLRRLYSLCKGFITTSVDEDFGMSAVEAMASGKPVIAPNDGGYKESVIDGKTGMLIDNVTAEKIVAAVRSIESELRNDPEKFKAACIERAKDFSKEAFIAGMKKIIAAGSRS